MKIGIIGCNDVSLCFAIKLSESINDITFYDENEVILHNLKNNIYITNEPYLQESLLIASNINTTNSILELIDKTDIIFYFIEHTKNIDETYNTNSLYKITDEYLMASNNNIVVYDKHFVITTDLNIGDCEKNKIKLEPYNVHIGFLPLSFKKGKILNMMSKLDYLILGYNNQYTSENVIRLFNRINRNMIKYYTMTLNSAELAKIILNTFIGVKDTFIDKISDLIDGLNLTREKKLIINAISDSPELSKKSFIPYRTHCNDLVFSDITVFNTLLKKYNVDDSISNLIYESNNSHITKVKEQILRLNQDNNIPFIINKIVDTSFEYQIIDFLLSLGFSINILDNNNIPERLNILSINNNSRLKFYKKDTKISGIDITFLI